MAMKGRLQAGIMKMSEILLNSIHLKNSHCLWNRSDYQESTTLGVKNSLGL